MADVESIAAELAALGEAPEAPLDSEDVLLSFMARLIRNKASVEAVRGRAEAVEHISEWLYREHNTRRVVAGHDANLAALPWRLGGVLVRFGTATPDDAVSISYAKLGVAESGTLVLFAGKDNPASNNWLVRDHLILLDGNTLVANYEQAWNQIRELTADSGQPRGINFISGPSSTADIALHMVTGAHGPQRVHVVYIGETEPGLLEQAAELANQMLA